MTTDIYPREVSVFDYVLPILCGPGHAVPADVAGTAWSIGRDLFITAGHSILNAKASKWMGIARGDASISRWRSWPIEESEIAEDFDVAVFRSPLSESRPAQFRWTDTLLAMTDPVQAPGYAYGLEASSTDAPDLNVRAFAGTMVSEKLFHGLAARPRVYELSFQCPRGLSGSPLLTRMPEPRVCGIVIGNSSTEMLIFSDRETTSDGRDTLVTERYEALRLGVALTANAILDDARFDMLHGSLRKHLLEQGLIS